MMRLLENPAEPIDSFSILLVDDCAEDRMICRRFLQKDEGYLYHITECSTAAEAVAWCQREVPDLILLDLMLPDSDGIECLQEIRQLLSETQSAIVILTGQSAIDLAIGAMKNGAQDYLLKNKLTPELFHHTIHSIIERTALARQVAQAQEQQQLLAAIALRIRQSLHLSQISNITVTEVRQFLKADRVLIYQFQPDMSGSVVAESVLPGWTVALGQVIEDTCFQHGAGTEYRQGKRRAIDDIYQAGLSDCHIQLLEQFEVKANLVVPILVNAQLWGLLIAHQCAAPRHWHSMDLDLLDQLAVQIAIAIQQASAYEQLQTELAERQRAERALQHLNQELEARVEQRTFELSESEERWHLALQGSNDGIYDWNLVTHDVFRSARWYEMWGYVEGELGTGVENWSSCIHPDDRDRVLAALDDHFSQKTPFFKEEYRIRHKDGSYLWVLDRGQALWNEANKPIRISGSVTDISDRKQAEAQLQYINEQLMHMNIELARATRLKDEFLASMSHELRTPLNAILGLSEGFQDEVFGAVNDSQRKAIATIERSGTHLLELINDILDLSKIESGKLELDISNVSIRSLCDTSLTFVRQMALKKQIHLSSVIAEHIGNTQADERRLRQALINLLSNAIKFTPDGGSVTLSVSRQPFTASAQRVQSEPEHLGFGSWLLFSITDTGIGIASENLEKLFQPFMQIDSKLNRQYAGTGLGLALVRRIAELHGGHVTVDSVLGQGSSFTIAIPNQFQPCHPDSLPAAFTSATSSSEDIATPAESVRSPLILLAEDHIENIMTFSAYLEGRGYRLIVANNGEEAIALTKARHPDLILMDIQMPIVDGLEAICQIRSDPEFAHLPIIALTALAMSGDREKCLQAGATDYLTKPIILKQLAERIHHLLSLSCLRQ